MPDYNNYGTEKNNYYNLEVDTEKIEEINKIVNFQEYNLYTYILGIDDVGLFSHVDNNFFYKEQNLIKIAPLDIVVITENYFVNTPRDTISKIIYDFRDINYMNFKKK